MEKNNYVKIDVDTYNKIQKIISDDAKYKKISQSMYDELVVDMKDIRVKKLISDHLITLNSISMTLIIVNIIFTSLGVSISNFLLVPTLVNVFITTLLTVTPYRNSRDAKDDSKQVWKERFLVYGQLSIIITVSCFIPKIWILTIILISLYIGMEIYSFMLKKIYKILNAQDDLV